MAVQAQYPSNILLLNCKNGQEGDDYSLQPQPGGLLDQSQMLFNNGGNGSRKRGRECGAAMGISTRTSSYVINPFSLQFQPPQLIDLSQLHNNHQQHVVSTGLGLSFGDQQQLQLQQQREQHHHHGCQSPVFSSLLSEGFASQIKQQHDEIDQFLQAQGEQLRRSLSEKRHRHFRALLSAAEETVIRRLREKEVEIDKARRRNAELEVRAAQLSVEAQVWQSKARAQEATAASLQAQLQHAIMSGTAMGVQYQRGNSGVGDDGGLSCAVGVEGQAEDAESAYIDPDRMPVAGPRCRNCLKRMASVVALPCRHLSMCTECNRHIGACPVCLTVKNSAIEVCLS